MGKKEKLLLAGCVVLVFFELVKYGWDVRVVVLGFIGYQVYVRWRNR